MKAKPLITDIALTANKFRSSIVFVKNERAIDGKSVMGLYTVWTDENPPNEVYIEGPDRDEAQAAIKEVFERHALELLIK